MIDLFIVKLKNILQMKLQSYRRLQDGTTFNLKIKSAVDKLVRKYQNDPYFSKYTREEIYDVVIEECIIDCKNKSNDVLDLTLNESNIAYLTSLKVQNMKPMDVFQFND